MSIELFGTIASSGHGDSLRWLSHVPERKSRRAETLPRLSVCLHVQRNPKVYQVFVRFSWFLFDLFWFLFIFVKETSKNRYTIK
jgi:hypothetical protein